MDLRLYLRVIWRFRYLVLGGFLVALAFAFLTMFRVGPHGISYRQQLSYRATETLWLTSKNSFFDASQQANLAGLAIQYVQIANSDIVASRVLKSGPLGGTYMVVQIPGPNNTLQPVISVTGTAHTPTQSAAIANRISDALAWWIGKSQDKSNAAPEQRVGITTISQPKPYLFEGRKLTVPIIIFLAVMIVTLGVAFILENLRPRPLGAPLGEIEPLSVPDYDQRSFEAHEHGDGVGEKAPVAGASARQGPE
jgi:capsular polysaccharide biosynthesis protein